METFLILLIGAGLFFIIMMVSGIMLTKSGKPYKTSLSVIHKLTSFFTAVFAALPVVHIFKADRIQTIQSALIVISCLIFVVAYFSGIAVLSLKKDNAVLLMVHRITPILTAISIIITIIIFIFI